MKITAATRTYTLLLCTLVFTPWIGFTQSQPRYEMLRVSNNPTNMVWQEIAIIATNELCRVLDYSTNNGWGAPQYVLSLTAEYPWFHAGVDLSRGSVVLGPAKVKLETTGFVQNPEAAVAVLEIVPVNLPTTPVGNTVIQPAGYPINIALESSTNLTTWGVATNGAYPSSESHRFFRMNLQIVPTK
jgi:hypothetical protein